MWFKYAIAMVTFALCNASLAYAYEFEFAFYGNPVHTDMAARAVRCAASAKSIEEITDCENQRLVAVQTVVESENGDTIPISIADMESAVIWSDDPIRELRWYKFYRVPIWVYRIAEDECAGKLEGLEHGLRCSSHYGPFQFLHAMESETSLPADQTLATILAWIEYAYAVAMNEKRGGTYHNDRPYCETLSAEYGSNEKFLRAMMPDGHDGYPCKKDGPAWRISTPFSFSCFLRSTSCRETIQPNDAGIRKAALGSILHVIQDSYAKGHTSRGRDSLEFIDRIERAPIKQFQIYGDQNHECHKKADKLAPVEDCNGSEQCAYPVGPASYAIDGPITASAKILKYYSVGAKWRVVERYLRKHVFVLDGERSGAGTTELMKRTHVKECKAHRQ